MNLKTKHITDLIKNAIKQVDANTEIILYGSRARGDEREDSDWDILILTNYAVDLNIERKFRNKLYDIELITGESLSVFVYSKNNWVTKQKITSFFKNVTQEGIML